MKRTTHDVSGAGNIPIASTDTTKEKTTSSKRSRNIQRRPEQDLEEEAKVTVAEVTDNDGNDDDDDDVFSKCPIGSKWTLLPGKCASRYVVEDHDRVKRMVLLRSRREGWKTHDAGGSRGKWLDVDYFLAGHDLYEHPCRPKNISVHHVWEKLEDRDYANLCIVGHYHVSGAIVRARERKVYECTSYSVKCKPEQGYGNGCWKEYSKIARLQRHIGGWVEEDRRYWPNNFHASKEEEEEEEEDVNGKNQDKPSYFSVKGLYKACMGFRSVRSLGAVGNDAYHPYYYWDRSPWEVFHAELFAFSFPRGRSDWVAGDMLPKSFSGDQEKLLLCMLSRVWEC